MRVRKLAWLLIWPTPLLIGEGLALWRWSRTIGRITPDQWQELYQQSLEPWQKSEPTPEVAA